jgi:hypothetical protein
MFCEQKRRGEHPVILYKNTFKYSLIGCQAEQVVFCAGVLHITSLLFE